MRISPSTDVAPENELRISTPWFSVVPAPPVPSMVMVAVPAPPTVKEASQDPIPSSSEPTSVTLVMVTVAEAAVVGRPDDTTGEAICAFVVLKRPRPVGDEAKAIAKQLRDWVGKEIGPIAKPKDIRFGDNLPKTRSGKIMRRGLRARALGQDEGDLSTLET